MDVSGSLHVCVCVWVGDESLMYAYSMQLGYNR